MPAGTHGHIPPYVHGCQLEEHSIIAAQAKDSAHPKLGARATVKLPLPQYSSSRSPLHCSVTWVAHCSMYLHTAPFG